MTDTEQTEATIEASEAATDKYIAWLFVFRCLALILGTVQFIVLEDWWKLTAFVPALFATVKE